MDSKRVLSSVNQGAGKESENEKCKEFNSSLFTNKKLSNEIQMKELSEGIESLKMSTDGESLDKTPRVSDANYKNCISNDLLMRLDANSPIKQTHSTEFFKQEKGISLVNCQKKINYNEEENDEELPKFNVKNDTSDLNKLNLDFGRTSKNYRLRTSIVSTNSNNNLSNYESSPANKKKTEPINFPGYKNMNQGEGKSSSNSINNNFNPQILENDLFLKNGSSNEQQKVGRQFSKDNVLNPYSPTFNNNHLRKRKDSSPFLNYYEGTNDFLFASVNGFNKNKIQQKNLVSYSEQTENNNNHNNSFCESSEDYYNNFNKNSASLEEFNNLQNNQSQFNQNIFNQNSSNQYTAQKNYVNNNENFNLADKLNKNNNYNNYNNNSGGILSELRASGKREINSSNNNEYNGNEQNLDSIYNQMAMNSRMQQLNQNQQMQFNQINQFNQNSQNQYDDDESSYIIEMFGKRGWVCEGCNNFNYESKF